MIFQDLPLPRSESIEESCKEGDLIFQLKSSYSHNRLTNVLTLHFQQGLRQLETLVGFKRKNIGRIVFRNDVSYLNPASFIFDNSEYQTSADAVLDVAKKMFRIITPYENLAKVAIFDTDHFNNFEIPRMSKLRAPTVYHTDHELSQQWKVQILNF